MWTKKNNSYTMEIVEMGAEFEKEMPHSDKALAKIASCFTTDDKKNTTKRVLCLTSSIFFVVVTSSLNSILIFCHNLKIHLESWDICVCTCVVCFPDTKTVWGYASCCIIVGNKDPKLQNQK